MGHIADWLVDKVHWDRHPRFTIHQNSKAIFLDAKHDAAEARDAESEGTKALRALNMELLDGGGIPGFGHLHRKSDHCQIPGPLYPIEIDRNAAQLFGIVTMGSHMACYTWDSSEDGRQMRLWVPRRANNKLCDAGKLDNTAAGGIANVRPFLFSPWRFPVRHVLVCSRTHHFETHSG